jgi:hypothetical protein
MVFEYLGNYRYILNFEYLGNYILDIEYLGNYILGFEYLGNYILGFEYLGNYILGFEYLDNYILGFEYLGNSNHLFLKKYNVHVTKQLIIILMLINSSILKLSYQYHWNMA